MRSGKLIAIVAVAGAFVVGWAGTGTARGNQIVNGDFETGNLNGWTVNKNSTTDTIGTGGVPYFGSGTTATDGTTLAAFNQANTNPGGTLSQTFTTVPNTLYTVQYLMGTTTGASQKLDVSVLGANGTSVLGSQAATSTANQAALSPFSFTFTADGSQATLQFLDDLANSSTGVNATLDNVSVTPEPAAGLLGVGALGLLARRRRAACAAATN